jgi:hypothetical protein
MRYEDLAKYEFSQMAGPIFIGADPISERCLRIKLDATTRRLEFTQLEPIANDLRYGSTYEGRAWQKDTNDLTNKIREEAKLGYGDVRDKVADIINDFHRGREFRIGTMFVEKIKSFTVLYDKGKPWRIKLDDFEFLINKTIEDGK